jgi:diguanylate cyclase (GGDEF)-like protein/PAS domain S-box-containing protein
MPGEQGELDSPALARSVLDAVTDAVLVIDETGRIRAANAAAAGMFGFAAGELVGLDVSALVPQSLRHQHRELVAGLDPAGQGSRVMGRGREVAARRRDGGIFPVEVTLTQVRQPDHRVVCATVRDITERRALEDRLLHLSLHDPLTGLGNRSMLTDRLGQVLARQERHRGFVAVLMCDVDHFKPVNDSYGHPVGDQLLAEIAARLRQAVRPEDTVVRFGGDEFVIVAEALPSPDTAAELAHRLQLAMTHPVRLGGHTLWPTLSVGIAVAPPPDPPAEDPAGQLTASTDTLLGDADLALYAAKHAGRARAVQFDPRMREQVLGRMQLLGDLPAALTDGQIEVHYQPVVDLSDRTVLGAEALIRWRHPTRGLLSPESFLPYAADTDLMVDLDRYVVTRACHQLTRLAADLHRPLQIWANLSARTIAHPALADLARQALAGSDCPPDNLTLEVTETALMHDLPATGRALHDLRDQGIRLAIDDFGTGHSALSYLTQLPVTAVKLDRAFVTHLPTDPVSQAIVEAVTTLSHRLDLITVAEGLETTQQLAAARRHGCHHGQGFLLGPPTDLPTFTHQASTPR